MIDVSVSSDPEEIQRLWQRHWPQTCLFDLWPVRACFQRRFQHTPHFLVAERQGAFCGLLALSWIDEEQYFGHFPGELWHGKTWLEQNRVLVADEHVFDALWEAVPDVAQIRYLRPDGYLPEGASVTMDEIGYLFRPPQYGYDFKMYMEQFSGKSRKKIRCEIDRLQRRGVSFRYDCLADVDHLFSLNLEIFREDSYFSDPRFLGAFEDLVQWLHRHNLLRVTAVLVGGELAAVDIGAVWNGTYTVVAGGTCGDFPGVAKLINFHHLEWACQQHLRAVDFLCGEFNWKNRFHLTPRPLYKMSKLIAIDGAQTPAYASDLICATG
ncbi:MAG: GNAT family N-acetyltransferase [Deltaproteobacteria bacterium]|nr:GNAT family N-acetyltransferase [Deltaproteobacteria bacterium]